MSYPRELIQLPQWVLWKTEERDGKPTKVPYQANGVKAKPNDSSTWTTFDKVIAVADDYNGIGFMFSEDDEFCGIDLDGCRDPDTGVVSDWAMDLIVRFDSYTEVSPSQTGVKIFVRGKNPRSSGKHCKVDEVAVSDKSPGIEVYDKVRYFAVTGQKLPDLPATIEDRQEVIDELCDHYFPLYKPPGTLVTRTTDTGAEVRAAKYLAKIEGAIAGSKGHDKTYHAACVLVLGFDLSPDKAFPILNEWNAKCKPPWSDRDLWHKLHDADKETGDRGHLLSDNDGYRAETVLENRSHMRTITERLPDIAYPHGQTDAANASRFIDQYHSELLYVPPWKKWLSWDGKRWYEDSGVGAKQRAKRYAKSLWNYLGVVGPDSNREGLGKTVTFIRSTNDTKRIKPFMELAAVDERVICPVADLNRDPYLLNVANGTIELTTGTLIPHNSADRITQLASVHYDPEALCPKWNEMLGLIFNGDDELIRYLQQLLGYSLSGDTAEHLLPIAYGKGCNGKSTVWNVMADLLGDYATLANDELLLGESRNHPTEKAALYQKRFVAISEPEKNSQLRESRVKELTGDRMITARRMKEDFWNFQRTHTFWLSTNHLPRIEGTDDGIWRRLKCIPFNVDLRDKVDLILDFDRWLVLHEGPGIMAWLVRGYRDYKENGLVEPAEVTRATQKYRGDSDPLGDFLATHCVIDPSGETLAAKLFDVYKELFDGSLSSTMFGKVMVDRFVRDRPSSGKYRNKTIYKGVRIRENVEKF